MSRAINIINEMNKQARRCGYFEIKLDAQVFLDAMNYAFGALGCDRTFDKECNTIKNNSNNSLMLDALRAYREKLDELYRANGFKHIHDVYYRVDDWCRYFECVGYALDNSELIIELSFMSTWGIDKIHLLDEYVGISSVLYVLGLNDAIITNIESAK